MYLYLFWFLYIVMEQVVEIHSQERCFELHESGHGGLAVLLTDFAISW